MAHDLNLKTVWIDDKTARVSWNDALSNALDKGRVGFWLFAFCVLVFGGMIVAASGDYFGTGILMMLSSFGCLFMMVRSHTKPNMIEISPDGVLHNGLLLDARRISRVEYGLRSQWTGRNVGKEIDPTQIRLWFDDRVFHVISTNIWETQINHEIKAEIEDVLRKVNKEKAVSQRIETHGKTGNFGMPEY